ncbi:MAG: hypothetical protein KA244_09790 [Deltaproteobacteria bacterium]|nr:hypothetical protein [Deltaproteobacteria bacterium]
MSTQIRASRPSSGPEARGGTTFSDVVTEVVPTEARTTKCEFRSGDYSSSQACAGPSVSVAT